MTDFNSKFTNEQARVYSKSQEGLESNFRRAMDDAVEAHRATVPLPHTNEQGDAVVHGCNMFMHFIRDNYFIEAKAFYFMGDRNPTLWNRLRVIRDDYAQANPTMHIPFN